MLLTSTSDTLEAVMGAAVDTTAPEFVVTYADGTTTAFTPGRQIGALNGTTAVTILSAPAASTQRVVKALNIYNGDAIAQTITVRFDDGTNEREMWSGLVGAGDALFWSANTGWRVGEYDVTAITASTGVFSNLSFTSLFSDMANGAQAYSFLPTNGGDGVTSIWRVDASSGGGGRTYTISSISTDTITITTTDAATAFFDTVMNGVSYLRIWNTSKVPAESAWVKAQPANNQLQVTDSADISGWLSTETIQVGDPAGSGFGGDVIVIDISPMQIALFGAAFRQTGIIVKASGPIAATSGDSVQVTPTGVSGSFVAATRDIGGVTTSLASTFIPCSELSPISDSNLVGIRDKIASTATIRFISSTALLV